LSLGDLPEEFKRLRLSNPLIAAPLALLIGIGVSALLCALAFYEPYSTFHPIGTPLA
jgi:hypothetical protein